MLPRLNRWKRTFLAVTSVICVSYLLISIKHYIKNRASDNEDDNNLALGVVDEELVYKLHDARPDDCLNDFAKKLPMASVIIIANNKPTSALLQTVWSVQENTPKKLLVEVIIIHDGCVTSKQETALHRKFHLRLKLKIVELTGQSDGFKEKLSAIQLAQGEALVFLEDDMICNKGWLEPLLVAVQDNANTVAVPQLDTIDHQTGKFTPTSGILKTVFTWDLKSMPYETSYDERIHLNSEGDLVNMPAMVGKTFAISMSFARSLSKLKRLGSFINVMEYSFAIWMCGGRIVTTSCSRVAKPYMLATYFSDQDLANSINLAQTWLGNYKRYFLASNNTFMSKRTSEISKFLSSPVLQCKNFKWYIHHVASTTLGLPPKRIQAYGQLRTRGSQMCFEFNPEHILIGSKTCDILNQFQIVYLDNAGQLRHGHLCATFRNDLYVRFEDCVTDDPKQIWKYNDVGQLVSSDMCMTHVSDPYVGNKKRQVVMAQKCMPSESNNLGFQTWYFTMVMTIQRKRQN